MTFTISNTTTAASPGPRFHTLDAPAIVALVRSIADAFAQLRTPYRPSIEGRIMRATPGPRAPISAALLDLEQECEWTLAFITNEAADVAGVPAPERTASVPARCAWLVANADAAAEILEEGDVMDLEVLEDRCRRMAGLPDPALEAEARRARLAGSMGLTAEVWASAERIARLAAQATGVPLGHATVRRWGAAGLVDQRETGGRPSIEYRLDSVVEFHAARLTDDDAHAEVIA